MHLSKKASVGRVDGWMGGWAGRRAKHFLRFFGK